MPHTILLHPNHVITSSLYILLPLLLSTNYKNPEPENPLIPNPPMLSQKCQNTLALFIKATSTRIQKKKKRCGTDKPAAIAPASALIIINKP